MILHLMKCEMCDNQFSFNPQEHPASRKLPANWLFVFEGEIQNSEGWHFCSRGCLQQWAQTTQVSEQPEQENPFLGGES